MYEQIRDINELHPTVKRGAVELKRRLGNLGYDMGISETYRTNERQNYLYEQGRSRPGAIITNARAGESIHNYRLAFDVFNNIKGSEYDAVFMNLTGKIGQEIGFEWGGAWSGFVDKPHFEFTNMLSLSQLQSGKTFDESILMKWERKLMDELKVEIENLKNEAKKLNQKIDEITNILKQMSQVYNSVEEIPNWGKETIEKLIKKQLVSGESATQPSLNLTYEMIRMYVTNDRAGLYD